MFATGEFLSRFMNLGVEQVELLSLIHISEAAFLSSLAAPEIRVEHLDDRDIKRMAELVAQYADLPLGSVDASVIAVAERLGVTTVMTIDRRHFTVVRPSHVDAFTLLP